MITAALMALGGVILTTLAGMLPDLPDPDETLSPGGSWAILLSYMQGASGWFPFALAAICVGLVATVAAGAILIRLSRMALSLFTGGGGS